jgi:hypothetical protein
VNQDQQPRSWWRDHWIALALVALVVVIATITILGYWLRWAWTELLWRWLELLIIPVVLAVGAFWFNRQERRAQNAIETRRQESAQALAREERDSDREIAEDRAREDVLQRYLDRMSELVLDKNLRDSKRGDAVRATARARTLTALRSLDGGRKGELVRFLCDSDLIGELVREESEYDRVENIIDLQFANLSGARLGSVNLVNANLFHANLSDANLHGANLSGANLVGAHLVNATLVIADLSGANLVGAHLVNATLFRATLVNADLSGTDLSGANLRGAILSGTILSRAHLRGANLSRAILSRIILNGVSLSYAEGWTNEQLAQAGSLVGATMPDGTVMTKEAWEEFKKTYGQLPHPPN